MLFLFLYQNDINLLSIFNDFIVKLLSMFNDIHVRH